MLIAGLGAAPELITDVKQIIAAFEAGGASAAQGLLAPEVLAEMAPMYEKLLAGK